MYKTCRLFHSNGLLLRELVIKLSATFAALADPTRRAILARLALGRMLGHRARRAVRHEHARRVEAPARARARGLIARRREAQWRPCRIEAGPLKEVADWAEHYRHIWEERLDRLDEYLQDLTNEEGEKSWS